MNKHASEEEWVLETPPLFRTFSNMNESINTPPKLSSVLGYKSPSNCEKIDNFNESEEEWIVETPPKCKTFQMNDEIKIFQEKTTSKYLSVNEITLINDDKNNKSEDKMFNNQTTLKNTNLTSALEEEWIADLHSYNIHKTNRESGERHGESYCRQSHFEPCANNESHGNRHGRSYNNQSQFKLQKIRESHEYKFVKSYFKSDENNNTDKDIYTKIYNRKPIHSLKDKICKSNENRFINLPYRSFNKSDKFKGDGMKWKPNIEAPEFVPESTKTLQSKLTDKTEQFSPNSSTYSHFSLRDLLNYDTDLMPSAELMDYADALKLRVLDRILEFEPSFREELEVLCQLNDGSLTDRNKKIISVRICTLVQRTLVNKPQFNHERYQRLTKFFAR